MIYLAERVKCQLVGMDDPQILRDPLEFMLAPYFMIDAEYNTWRSGVSYVERLLKGLDYEEFNRTHLMPSLIVEVCIQTFAFRFFLFC